ncbi:hypothetical protein [Variovorax paradoxus]|uniref:hypothetical protein n=1 Tax=Variovorax paradoxus TaxID=34073 RepID=UPI00277E7D5E|nr:hypothetical protein [Variovorax paradoxus]MDP9930706.1 hypothetical protein [Variovorax paradoxus]
MNKNLHRGRLHPSPMTTSLKIYAVVAGAVVLFVLGSFVYVLSNFVVREIPTSVSYDVIVPPESASALFQSIGTAVAQIGLKSGKKKEATDIRRREWKNNDDSQGVSWDLSGDGQVHISIFSAATGSDESYLNMISLVQKEIAAWSGNMKSHLQLAPGRFGTCASPERPNIKDSTCIYERTGVFEISEMKHLLQSHSVK